MSKKVFDYFSLEEEKGVSEFDFTGRKLHVVGPYKSYGRWLTEIGFTQTEVLEEADLVLLTGGEDINPALYGEPKGKYTHFNAHRDAMEVAATEKAFARGIPVCGTCRGIQLLGALNGAKLVQDLDHPGYHDIEIVGGETVTVNSLHHQAVNPLNLPPSEYKLLGWANQLSHTHLNGWNQDIPVEKEVEIICFPKTKSFGWQFHPEMMSRVAYRETFRFLDSLVNDSLNNKF